MGYESKIFVVEKHYFPVGKPWGQVIAIFDLAKCSAIGNYMRDCNPTDCYILDTDGNTEIKVDRYDKPLTETSLEDFIQLLEKEVETDESFNGSPYRRLKPLLAMLKEFAESTQWRPLTILHFGH